MASATDEQARTNLAANSGAPTPGGAAFNMPFQPGELVAGKYKIERLIGTGGVGFVVAALHVGFDEMVALKFLRPEFTSHAEAVTRFTIEARASFKIKSEHVARVLDVDTLPDGTPFIAMELLHGTDLRSLLDHCRMLAIEPAIDYALQICEALAAAHALHVIHRDIKPENLFLTGPGDETDSVKVLDFGISKVALAPNARQTQQALTRVAVGTPPYMSPEQVRAASDLDARSDIWSVGCVLYELLTGTAAFDRVSLMQSCAAVLEEDPVPVRDLRPVISQELDAVVMRCLQKDAALRYADVADLAFALAPFGSGRFAGYPERCRALLNGENTTRRSTPSSLPQTPRTTGVTRHSTGVVRHATGAMMRQPTGTGTGRIATRTSTVAYPGILPASIADEVRSLPPAPLASNKILRWPLVIGVGAGLAFGGAYALSHRRSGPTTPRLSAAPVSPAAPQPSAAALPLPAPAAASIAVAAPNDTAHEAPSTASSTPAAIAPNEAPIAPAAPAPEVGVATAENTKRVSAAPSKTKSKSKPSARTSEHSARTSDEPDVGF